MKLLLFYLTDNGRHFTFSNFVKLLNESVYKDQWKMIVLTHDDDLLFYTSILDTTLINHQEFIFPSYNNYLQKVKFAIQYAKDNHFPYMMKCDNDLFFRGRTLDYMINNLELLEEPQNLTLGPLLSSGIPCVEYFMNDFLNELERTNLHHKLLQTEFTDIWGAKYIHLNKFTLESTSWDGSKFLDAVKQNQHYYKGIHPIRVNLDAIKYLNSCIIYKKDKFYEDTDLSIIADKSSPYLCNSVFCIKTSIYEQIVYDSSLYVDDFDEVPLNKYAWMMNTTHLFVKNGYGLHMYYNTIPNNRVYEKEFCDSFFVCE